MPTALAIKNPNFTLPAGSGRIVPCAMFGGTPQNPIAPTQTLIVPSSVFTTVRYFAMDPSENAFYYLSSNGLWRVDILAQSQLQMQTIAGLGLSSSMLDITISADG